MLLLAKPTGIIPSHHNSTKDDIRTVGKDFISLFFARVKGGGGGEGSKT